MRQATVSETESEIISHSVEENSRHPIYDFSYVYENISLRRKQEISHGKKIKVRFNNDR